MSRRSRVTLVVLAASLTCLLGLAATFVWRRGGTPSIPDSAGRRPPRALAELEWVMLGGARQAVLLRGADTTKPVVLFLHGGPGMPAMYLAHAFQRPLEFDFLMVQWDRRGAGKSYVSHTPRESLTVRRTLADLYELTQWLRRRFGQGRIYLVGHSWGTYLGLLAVSRHPEWYRAYIGMGQLVPDTATAHAVQRQLVLEEARRRRDTALVARLGSPSVQVRETDLFRMGGELRYSTSFWPLLRTGLMAPEYTLLDAWNVQRGAQVVGAAMARTPGPALPPAGAAVGVPVFLFLGRHDYNTPSAVAAQYLASLSVPLKGVVWFEESAHFPFLEEPERFRLALLRVDSIVSQYWVEGPPR